MPTQGSAAKGSYNTVSVGVAATLIKAASVPRCSIIVRNNHASNILYVASDSAVTTATGFPVGPGESVSFEDYRGDIYGIASGAATDTRYLQVGA